MKKLAGGLVRLPASPLLIFIIPMIILKDKAIEATKPEPIVTALQEWLMSLDDTDRLKEHLFVVLLDARLKVTLVDVVSIGTLNASLVHPREVFIRAIATAASAVIIAHNHPSGTREPSDADLTITRRLRDAGRIIGIELVDHLIVTASGFYSFVEHGRFPAVW
jgi:DNA repair protein RadC